MKMIVSDLNFLALVDSCLCTNIRKLSRIITRIYDSFLEPSGLNINQLGLLLTIKGQNANATLSSIGEVGDRLVMEKSTLSRNLRKLEDYGYIETDINPENRSQKTAHVTESGLKVIFDAYGYWDEVQTRIRAKFGVDNFKELTTQLTTLQSDLLEEFGNVF